MSNPAKARSRPLLEILEDRTLPSTSPNVIDLSGLQVNTSSYSSSDILVQFRSAVPQSVLAATTIGPQLGLVTGLYEVNLSSGVTVNQALAAYLASPAVVTAEPDYSMAVQGTPNSANFNQQWALNNTGQNGGTAGDDIGAVNAWTVTTGSPNVTVAVMDTGIAYDNADLYDNIWINQAEIPTLPFAPGSGLTGSRKSLLESLNGGGNITFADLNNPLDQGKGKITNLDGAAYIDASDILAPMVTVTINGKLYDTGTGGWAYTGNTQDGDTAHPNDFIGWNFVNNTNNPLDDNGHGTNVAGIIGGTGNNGGTYGVSPQVSLMAVKFLDASGGGSLGAFIEGLDYSILHGAKITNNSWSGAADSQILIDAIDDAQNAGQIFVAAAGNQSENTDVTPVYPSSFAINNIVSVAASDQNDHLASFSNYGVKTVSLAAPGVNILSTVPNGTYSEMSGTSQATPMVAGVLALVWAEHPTWTYEQVITQVLDTVTVVPALAGKTATGGVVNAAAAVGYKAPVLPAPTVVGTISDGPVQNTLNSIVVTFSLPINTSTFTTASASLLGPNGKAIALTAVTAVTNSSGKQFNITFATQTASGTYTLVLGAAIHGTNGVALHAFQTTYTVLNVNTFASSKSVSVPKMSNANSTITINEDIPISQVQVLLNITSTNDSDLYILLTSPSGTEILLSNRRGGSGHNYTNTLFNDNAATLITSGSAPFTGSFQPEAALANFETEDARGTWTLTVENRGSSEVATITGWSLIITGNVSSSTLGTQSLSSQSFSETSVQTTVATQSPVTALGAAIVQNVVNVSAAVETNLLSDDVWPTLSGNSSPTVVPPGNAGGSTPLALNGVSDHVFLKSDAGDEIRATAWLSRLSGGDADVETASLDVGAEDGRAE